MQKKLQAFAFLPLVEMICFHNWSKFVSVTSISTTEAAFSIEFFWHANEENLKCRIKDGNISQYNPLLNALVNQTRMHDMHIDVMASE